MSQLPFFKQRDTMDCGPTCLRMVAKFYKKDVSLSYLREKTGIGKEGVNMLGISDAAEIIGFRTHALKISLPSLMKEAKLPCILHWNQNHFVVLYKVKDRKFTIADPAKEVMTYTESEFKSHWISDKNDEQVDEGVALMLEPTPAFYKNENVPGDFHPEFRFQNMINYIMPYKKLILQLFIGLGIASLLQLFLPFLTQSVVDVGINTRNIHFTYIVLMAQLAVFAGRTVTEMVRSWILLHISTRINISILTDFLIKLMKLPVSFFDSKQTGDILQRMNDHSRIETFLTGSSISTLFSLVNLVVFSFVLAIFNLQVFTVFVIASVLYSSWVALFLRHRRNLDYKKFEVASKEQSATIQLIQGMQEIKLNGVEKSMRWNWESLQARLFRISVKALSLNQWQQGGAFFINEGKNIFITFLSAKAVIDGQMTLGAMLAIQYIIGQLNSPIEQMIGFMQSLQNARISVDRLNEIHELEDEEPTDKELQRELPPAFTMKLTGGVTGQVTRLNLPGVASYTLEKEHIVQSFYETDLMDDEVSITLTKVSFTYPGAGNEPVLKNINLSIPKGKTTAIVGTSGSGKTTLLKLLLKFYNPQKGEIRLDDVPLSSFSHKQWRSHCGVVMQESYIFSDTIARNIAVGAEKIDRERLNRAVAVANIHEFIKSLPLGFNTKIGSEGMGISMGQKQRILIARAVYKNPEFIFLDEATNSLDANNESVIVSNLASFLRDKTVVVVAHRLSTVRHADQIVVLNEGTIAEKGTHEELVNLKGKYYTLVKNQLELGE